MTTRTNIQIKAEVTEHYAAETKKEDEWIAHFVATYKLALGGDEKAMEEGQALYESDECLKYSAKLAMAMHEAGLE